MYKGYKLHIDNIISKAGKDVLSDFKDKTSAGARLKTRTRGKNKIYSCHGNEERGADGLFNVVSSSVTDLDVSIDTIKEKIDGVTTDGELANTERQSGLWARLEQYLGRLFLNSLCACHRPDLAMEDMFRVVPELTTWQSKVTRLSSYYRTSGLRRK